MGDIRSGEGCVKNHRFEAVNEYDNIRAGYEHCLATSSPGVAFERYSKSCQ